MKTKWITTVCITTVALIAGGVWYTAIPTSTAGEGIAADTQSHRGSNTGRNMRQNS